MPLEPLYEFGVEATRWLQTTYPDLEQFLLLISGLGDLEFYLALVPLIYWCINKRFGRHAAYLMVLSYNLNAIIKHVVHEPRPYWLEGSIGVITAPHYGIPSGHTQIAATTYLFLAYWVRRTWVWLLALALIFLMALSRVYLGVHFVHDVVAGALLAAAIVAGYWLWCRYFQQSFRNRILGQRLLAVVLVPLGTAVLYLILRWIFGGPAETVTWAEYIPAAEIVSMEDVASSLGMLLGLGVGFVLEATRVHFEVQGTVNRRILRYLLGIVVTLAIWRGLGLILPEDPLWLALPLRLFRYWLAGVWVAYYAPLVFVKVGLAGSSPRPEVELSVSDGSIMRG